jgi:hypothetical protein
MSIYNKQVKNLESILGKDYSDLWHANKDSIEVCNVCEYRYMCIDKRVPVKRNNDSWYFEEECDYNPFISKWKGEKWYKSLSESGITSNIEIIGNNGKDWQEVIDDQVKYELYKKQRFEDEGLLYIQTGADKIKLEQIKNEIKKDEQQ